ncbi:type II toxin-antitoxin system HicB family antitoxin [candidate division KSB1 bacterium]|nr:MAG: type II toxin-antitoxin system HicB family antitoxin [candidate division KSB1 bacterium]MBC6951538.1 type II toxin-antitoxin system HicB family antitoxin [candidate division KSB1 bacterium]MCE7942133.1 type II toxin-antitoxin system HicB family antitoxin [Chlorobi bacterium CHB1]
MNRKNGNIKPLDLHVLIEKEGWLYSALCLELDVASQGRTLSQAKKILLRLFNSILRAFAPQEMKKSLSLVRRRC